MSAQLGPWRGTYNPDYQIEVYENGDPSRRIKNVDFRSVVSITTSKTLQDIAGTFTITLKDASARWSVQEMDVVKIFLKGHRYGMSEVLRGVVDECSQSGSATPSGGEEDTVITGRCTAKYLQINSMFLPVWDTNKLLPTALSFGLGDWTNKAGGMSQIVRKDTPKEIFDYIMHRWVYGQRQIVGESGTPNARFWINTDKRFEQMTVRGGGRFKIPFIQFDEDTIDAALKRFEILGFTEAWVDEVGNVVYRHPAWDAPVAYKLSTDGLEQWSLARSDVGAFTYVEVVPSGNPGLSSAYAQALMAGRAPIPTSYVFGALGVKPPSDVTGERLQNYADQEFVIETDKKGVATATGQKNRWYRLQRRLGLRPLQISSPLLFTPQDAQAQAEGLLQFMSRMVKSGTLTIPGEPIVKLGTSIQVQGELRGKAINETFYIEGVSHNYTDGTQYTTSLQLTHGRDPWDPKWGMMVLPPLDPKQLAEFGGILSAGGTAAPSSLRRPVSLVTSSGSSGVDAVYAQAAAISAQNLPYVWGGGHNAQFTPNGGGYDCSGYVSACLHAAGWLSFPMVSGDLAASWGKPGEGSLMTVWANSGHVYIEFKLPSPAARRADTVPDPGTSDGPHLRSGWPGPEGTSGFTPRHWDGT